MVRIQRWTTNPIEQVESTLREETMETMFAEHTQTVEDLKVLMRIALERVDQFFNQVQDQTRKRDAEVCAAFQGIGATVHHLERHNHVAGQAVNRFRMEVQNMKAEVRNIKIALQERSQGGRLFGPEIGVDLLDKKCDEALEKMKRLEAVIANCKVDMGNTNVSAKLVELEEGLMQVGELTQDAGVALERLQTNVTTESTNKTGRSNIPVVDRMKQRSYSTSLSGALVTSPTR